MNHINKHKRKLIYPACKAASIHIEFVGGKVLSGISSTGYYVDNKTNPIKSSELQLKFYVYFDLALISM